MPFIPHNERVDIAEGKEPVTVGQLCYIAYKEMVRQWNENPRWTTAHNIYKKTFYFLNRLELTDEIVARELAWWVFFNKYVTKYEDEREKENGTI